MSSQYFKNVSLTIDAIETKPATTIIDVYGKPIHTKKRLRILFQLNAVSYIMDCFQENNEWFPHLAKHNQKEASNKSCNYCGYDMQKEPLCSFLNDSKQILFNLIKQNKTVRLKLLMI